MVAGTVKSWIGMRGFGFLAPDTGGVDVFVHIKTFERAGLPEPSVGDRLQFLIETQPDGRRRAVELQRAE